MICPHQEPQGPLSIRCQLIDTQLAGPANPNYPCLRCQSEWSNRTPPTADTLTPTLQAIVQIQQPGPPDWDESQPSRGIGDTAYKLLRKLGIRPRRRCGCKRRQAWLNRLLPYR